MGVRQKTNSGRNPLCKYKVLCLLAGDPGEGESVKEGENIYCWQVTSEVFKADLKLGLQKKMLRN